jgi:hypothetical protein
MPRHERVVHNRHEGQFDMSTRNQRIDLRIERGIALQDIERNAIFGYLASLSTQGFLTNVGKKVG